MAGVDDQEAADKAAAKKEAAAEKAAADAEALKNNPFVFENELTQLGHLMIDQEPQMSISDSSGNQSNQAAPADGEGNEGRLQEVSLIGDLAAVTIVDGKVSE